MKHVTEIWRLNKRTGLLVSSFGRICLRQRTWKTIHGGTRKSNPKPTFGVKTRSSKTARHYFRNFFNKRIGNCKVHRLVCETFHGKAPFKKAVVIHMDENSMNNRADNLKWGTQKENLNMPGFIAYCKSRVGKLSPMSKHMAKRKAA